MDVVVMMKTLLIQDKTCYNSAIFSGNVSTVFEPDGGMKQLATIKDVARHAGVGVGTVSRVINESGYVAEETRKRVLAAMKVLDFQPNLIARGLVSRKTSMIGLIIPDVANPFFADVARGVEDAAIQSGFTVILCNSDWKPERERMYLNLLQSKWAEGIIVVGSRLDEAELVQTINGLPYVLVDRPSLVPGGAVWSDNERGAKIATEHLISRGSKYLLHIAGPSGSRSSEARENGFREVVENQGAVQFEIVRGDFRYQSGFDIAQQILSRNDRPDGIFAGNDLMAVGVIQGAAKLGIRVPDDLLVMGYDNISMSEYVNPALTTIDQPAQAMGKAAFEIFHDRLSGSGDILTQQEFEPRLIERLSTLRYL